MATLSHEKLRQRKKRRLKWCMIFTLMEVAVAPELVSITHQLLVNFQKGKIFENVDYSYLHALRFLITDERAVIFFIFYQILWCVFLVYISMSVEPTISEVDTVEVTDSIRIPVPAGNGQYGEERFLREEEKEEIFGKFEFTGKEALQGNGGLVVQMQKDGKKERILYVADGKHSLTVGATGAGKSRRVILETMWLQMMSGLSIAVSDVKGELYYYTSPFAEKKDYKLYTFDLRDPRKGMRYNYMQPILRVLDEGDVSKAIDYTWDLVSVLVGQQKGEPIWYNGECASIAATILIMAIDAPREYANLTNAYYFLAYMCKTDQYGEMPINQYLTNLRDDHPAKGVFALAQIAPFRTRSSFFTSALGTLRLFTNPYVAAMTAESDFDLRDISREKSILYMMIPDEKKTLYPLVSLMITQLYTQQIELANENGLRVPVDTDYDLDEVGNFPYIPILPDLLSAGRSRGLRANLIIQDTQQLQSKYKEEYKNIMANCQVKCLLKTDDEETLKQFSALLGKYTVEVSSASTSASEGKMYTRNNLSVSSSASLAGRSLLEPAELKRINAPYAVLSVTGEYPCVNYLPDLSAYRLNDIYGLGDEEYNREIIMERESKRRIRDSTEIKLWGIWKRYQQQDSTKEEQKEEKTTNERVSFL